MNRFLGCSIWGGFLFTLFYLSLHRIAPPSIEPRPFVPPIAHFGSLRRTGIISLEAGEGMLSPTQEISHHVRGMIKEQLFSCDELILNKNKTAVLSGHVHLEDMKKGSSLLAQTATIDLTTQNFLLEGPIECIVDSVEISDYAPFKR